MRPHAPVTDPLNIDEVAERLSISHPFDDTLASSHRVSIVVLTFRRPLIVFQILPPRDATTRGGMAHL